MRLYAVITPPADVLADLADTVDRARAATPGVPWTPPEAWHLVLARFGSLGLNEVTVLKDVLTEIGSYCPPLGLRLVGGGVLPQDADQNADELEVGVEGDVEELWSLARAIPAMVRRHGLFLDRRSFHPAVSVATAARGPFDATSGLRVLDPYWGPEWTATDMRLARLVPHSESDPGIGDFVDVVRYPLSAPPEPAGTAGP